MRDNDLPNLNDQLAAAVSCSRRYTTRAARLRRLMLQSGGRLCFMTAGGRQIIRAKLDW